MTAKFEHEFQTLYSKRLQIVSKITSLTDQIGRLLSKHHSKEKFIPTALQFARVFVETADALITLSKLGHIAQAYALLRWYLELSHLLLFLYQNSDKYEDWLNGEQIRPKKIGRYFEKSRLPTWKTTYQDWSNVLHGNSVFLENYHSIAQRTPKSNGQVMLVGNILINVAFITQKANYFLLDLLHPIAQRDELEPLLKASDEFDKVLRLLLTEQLNAEAKLMDK